MNKQTERWIAIIDWTGTMADPACRLITTTQVYRCRSLWVSNSS